MNTEKRMIHSYEVVSSLKIGEKEVVLAMDEKNTDGEKYMTCFVERNELFELYHESMLSDDYAEIAKIYGARIANEGGNKDVKCKQSTKGWKPLRFFRP